MKTSLTNRMLLVALLGAVLATTARAGDKNAFRCYVETFTPFSTLSGRFPAVGVASNGSIDIVHEDGGLLVHSRRDGVFWSDTPLFVASVDDISLEVGPDQAASAAYVDAPTGYVKWFDPAQPAVVETVNPAGPAADGAHVVQNAGGMHAVLFFSPVDGGLHYTEHSGGGWTVPLRLASADGLGGIAFDPGGNPWVVYSSGSSLGYAYRNSGGSWIHATIIAGQTLGTRPAICRTSGGQMRIAWTRTNPVAEIMSSYSSGGTWTHETVDDLDSAYDPELTIFEEPWGNDITIVLRNPISATGLLYNRFGAAVWDRRAFGPGTAFDVAAAAHHQTGAVLVYRAPGGMRVRTQEYPPAVSGYFSPNPAVGGEPVELHYSMGCADRLELDGDFLIGGTVLSGYNVGTWAPGPHTLTALNGFMTASTELDLAVIPFGAVSLQATPQQVAIGNPVTLTWNVVGADTVNISPLFFGSNQSSGSTFTFPLADTTYTLWAENTGFGTTEVAVAVDVELFTNFSFTATGGTLVRGETARLDWIATGADTVYIEPGGLQFVGPTGQMGIAPQDTTVYTMTAINAGYGQQSAQVTVPVVPLRIVSLVADPDVAVSGEAVNLSWNVAGTANVTIDGLGPQSQQGNATVFPVVDTDYTLTAEWEGFTASDTVTVQVVPYLQLTPSFSATEIERTPPAITPGVAFDVWVHWTGPARRFNGLEFALQMPPTGLIVTSSQLLVSNAANFGTSTSWQIYGDCVTSATDAPLMRVTLLPTDSGALAGQWLTLGAVAGGPFPAGPGFFNCSGGAADLVPGAALPLDPAVSAVPVPGAGRTAITGIHPNPFNPQARIRIALSGRGEARAGIYDLAGRRVRSLDLGAGGAGERLLTWDGRDDSGRDAPSGVYLVRLEEAGQVATGRAVLVR